LRSWTDICLREIVPAGPEAAKEAEKVRTRLQAEVDARRNPRTRVTVNQLLERYLELLDTETSTVDNYASLIRRSLAMEGYYTIVNETIDVADGGVSGVALGNVIEFLRWTRPEPSRRPVLQCCRESWGSGY
jgi:hypothetical protein